MHVVANGQHRPNRGPIRHTNLFIGFNLHGTGPTSTAGPFVMSGRFQDSGTSTANNIRIVPIHNSDRARLSGDQQFAGQQGTIFTHFKGVAFPTTSPHQVGEGSFVILSGTGAYAGIRGRGSFLIAVDQISNRSSARKPETSTAS